MRSLVIEDEPQIGADLDRCRFAFEYETRASMISIDVGLLWTPTDMVYEVDGEPIAAVVTHGAVKGPATVRLSTALADWAGGKVPDHPESHLMTVQSLRIFGPRPDAR